MSARCFSQYFRGWMNRVRGAKARPGYKPRKWPKLGLDVFEDRIAPAVLPAPLVSFSQTVAGGFAPSVAMDPANPLRLVLASTDGVNIDLRISEDGGATWTPFFQSSPTANRVFNPTISPDNPDSVRAFARAWNPTVAITQPNSIGEQFLYMSHIETDNTANKGNGALVVHKFDISSPGLPTVIDLSVGRIPAQLGTTQGRIVYSWTNQDPVLNPVIAVNNNVSYYSDPGLDDIPGTSDFGETIYSDPLAVDPSSVRQVAPVFVAWNSNATVSAFSPDPSFLGPRSFNPHRIFVVASGDGGLNFTNPMAVDDDGWLPLSDSPTWGATTPRITFSPNNSSSGAGEIVFAWSNTRSGRMTVDASSLNTGNFSVPRPVASHQTFLGFGSSYPDAQLDSGNAALPHIPRVSNFSLVVAPGHIADPLATVTDLNVTLALANVNLESTRIELLYYSNISANVSITPPDRRTILLRNRIDEAGNSTGNRIMPGYTSNVPQGLPATAGLNKGFLGVYDFSPQGLDLGIRNIIGTTFDADAARFINDPANIRPYVGSFRPEGGPGQTHSLTSYTGLTGNDLVGRWVLRITDFRFDGNQPPLYPPNELEFWRLDVSFHLQDNEFGNDRTVGSDPLAPFPTLVTGPDSSHPTRPTPVANVGIGAGHSIAFDRSAGSFSPYAGRLYMAYTFGNDVFLTSSDNHGGDWSVPVRVNDDSVQDNFTEGNRFQFQPNVTVDPLTGTVVVTWYDARLDAANTRVSYFMATSLDGGETFSPQVPINRAQRVRDAITNELINAEPIPSDLRLVGNTGFGSTQALVAYGGHVNAFWSGNNNGGALSVQQATVKIAAGPRVIYSDSGPVIDDMSDPFLVTTYNNTFALDGTRQIDGFVVTFDRPIKINSFNLIPDITGALDVEVYYLAPNTPVSAGDVLTAGTPVPVASIDPIDADVDIPGAATTFFVRFATPQNQVGTYSYLIRNVRDTIRNPNPTLDLPGITSSDTPRRISDLHTIRSSIFFPGLPAGQVVDDVIVTISFDHASPNDLVMYLISPSGTPVLLFDGPSNDWGPSFPFSLNTVWTNIQFTDSAPVTVGGLSQSFDFTTLVTTFTGSARPDALIAFPFPQPGLSTAFDGEGAGGNWTLVVSDTDGGGIGNLTSWSIRIIGAGGIPLTELELGNPMDQDADGIYGEIDNDVYSTPRSLTGQPLELPYDRDTLPLIIPGPRIIATTPSTIFGSNASSVVVTFDRDMDPTSFDASDILRLHTPAGTVTSGFTVTMIDPRNFRISFPTQLARGPYSLEIGPNIMSMSGHLMDANMNAGLDRLRGSHSATTPLLYNEYSTLTAPPVTITPNGIVSMPLTITDALAIAQALTVPPGTNPASIDAIQVRLNITHPQPRDLIADLVSPSGTRVRLFTNVGPVSPIFGNFTNTLFMDAYPTVPSTPIQNGFPPFAGGPYTPQFPLSALIGESTQGTWRLEITNTGSLVGSINNFTLRFPYAVPGTGLGELGADRSTVGFTVYNLNPTDESSRDVWTPVGPSQVVQATTAQAGRVTAVAVDPSDPTGNTVYIGAAAGGVWKTTNFLTNDPSGPTWVPLTDFGGANSLIIGSITVIPRNNDPNQSIILAVTGNTAGGSPNTPTGNTPGVGILRSLDGGRTWRLLDSTVNVDAFGNVLPFSSPLRDHVFAGSVGFRLVYDPFPNSSGQYTIYLAVSGSAAQNGVWRSSDNGNTWTRILRGNATDVALAAGSQGIDGNLQILYAAVNNSGVFMTVNAPFAPAATVANPLGSFYAINGGGGNFLIQNGGVPLNVNNPTVAPTGPGIIRLAVPALTDNPVKNDLYQGWIYAMTTQGIYLTKDFGANWTRLRLPRITPDPLVDYGTNNESRPDLDVVSFWSNFGFNLIVDPLNPNIIYAGGGTMVKIDATLVKDAHNYVTADYSNATLSLLGGVNGVGQVQLYNPNTGGYVPADTDYINLRRDPENPFLSPSTIPVTGGTAFLKDGTNVKWQPLRSFLEGTTGVFGFSILLDPLTNKTRLLYATETGIYSVIDADSGTIGRGNGTEVRSQGVVPLPERNRNGTLQIALTVSGAVQPSQLAADLAGALFYATTPIIHMGSPVSSADPLFTGDTNYNNRTHAGTWVGVDPTGTGNAYQFQAGGSYVGLPGANTNFFRFIGNTTDPASGGISRTSGLFFPGGAGGGTSQWQQFNPVPGFFPTTPNFLPNFGQATINPRDPRAVLLGSNNGRLYRTTDAGLNWFPIATPAEMGNSYVQAVAFGAPNSNPSLGPIVGTNNFIYAGTVGGRIYVSLTGGSPWTLTSGLDGSAVQKIVANPNSGRFDAYAVTLQGVYYLPDARVPTPTWQNITGNLFALTSNIFGVSGDGIPAVTQLTSLAVDWRGFGTVPNDQINPQPPVIYVGGNGGVFRTKNAGATSGTVWTIFPDMVNDGAPANGGYLPHGRVMDLDLAIGDFDPITGQHKRDGSGLNMLVATIYGRGQWAIRLDNNLPPSAFVSGPRIISATDSGPDGGFPTLTVTFNGPVYQHSFDPSDVSLVSLSGNVSLGVRSVTPIPNIDPITGVDRRNTFRIAFDTPTVFGNYTLTIGPNISDMAGNRMNQDGDTVNGEAIEDRYSQTVTVSALAPTFTVLSRIAGTTFLDINADGVRQSNEPGLSGRTVYLDLDNNGAFTPGEPIRTTDAQGRYDFGYFAAGNYTVRVELFSSHTLTGNAATTGNTPVVLGAGSDQINVDIGYRTRASIFPTRVTTNLFTPGFPNSNTAYVYNVFRALLNRDPTPSELAYHVNALNSGYSRLDYATSIYNWNESLFFQVDQIYRAIVKHPADLTSQNFWANHFRNGIQPEWLIVQLVTAPGYTAMNPTNTAFINGLYRDILGRTPNAADIAFWSNFLATRSRFDMAMAFAYSAEVYTRVVEDVFVQFLRRQPTATDINHWVNLLVNRRLSVSRMVVLLLASSEFATKSFTP